MKINNLKINGFGKIENKEINLENKINIIYGKNESGKSTIFNFIVSMLYGCSKLKKEKIFLILKNINLGIQRNFPEK